jgi:tetratricopeptide (TPR) repeat protein
MKSPDELPASSSLPSAPCGPAPEPVPTDNRTLPESPSATVTNVHRFSLKRAGVIVLILVVLGAAGYGIRLMLAGSHGRTGALPDDPRASYAGPFRNVHADVQYVGAETCGKCHVEIAADYARHPMARTLLPIAEIAASLPYDRAHNNPFQKHGVTFSVEPNHGVLRQALVKMDEKQNLVFRSNTNIHYAIGSGNHGHSFVTNRSGYLFQVPVSWFSPSPLPLSPARQGSKTLSTLPAGERASSPLPLSPARQGSKTPSTLPAGERARGEGVWDISPGFSEEQLIRPMTPFCFFCHSNHALPWQGTRNRYREPIFQGHGIGCERCHGPGEQHVLDPGLRTVASETASFLQGAVRQVDYTIVNPGKLKWKLREAVCQQCHLEGEVSVLPRGRDLFDFRPGLPLESCWSVFVPVRPAGSERKAVNHVEQMYLSRCFVQSSDDNKLGCISCHDPHKQLAVPQRAAFYRGRCLKCHGDSAGQVGTQSACTLPPHERRLKNKEDSCVACHMPRYQTSDIAHAASTDHRIPRVAGASLPEAAPGIAQGMSLVHFQRGADTQDPQLARDLGVALADLVMKGKGGPRDSEAALKLLDKALTDDPNDWDAWERKGSMLYRRGRLSKALAAAEHILANTPERELALVMAAFVTQELKKFDASLDYWRRAIALNPWIADYHASLATILVEKRAWAEARPACKKWLELAPASVPARQLWIECLLEQGNYTEARAEFARIEALAPPNLRELQIRLKRRLGTVE